MKFLRSSHSVYDCRYHIVWATKYRKKILRMQREQDECKKIIEKSAKEFGMGIQAIEVDEDHIHLYIQIPPQRSIGRAVGILKSLSARWMFKRFPYFKKRLWSGELWGDSYFVRSIGEGVTAEVVKKYILNHALKALEPAQVELFPKGRWERA